MGTLGDPRRSSRWHAHRPTLSRVVTDLIVAEAASLRPGGADLPAPPWAPDLPIGSAGLGLDSLERMSVATALSEALHLHHSGQEDLLLTRRTFGEWLELIADALRTSDARVTFRTSGSTGAPRACEHSLASLVQEVEYMCEMLGGVRRVLSAVPAHHIYGFLFTVLAPAQLGLHDVVDIRRLTPQTLGTLLEPGDLVVSHPAHWELVARHTAAPLHGVRGITSTAPCPAALAATLEQRGLLPLLQIYGSSETAGVGWRTASDAPYALMPFWSRSGADNESLRRALPDGSGVEHVPADHIEWLKDNRFVVGARRDDAVQVGGINVFPARVRAVLLTHPLVVDAAVRLMTPGEGSRLKAFIVPLADTDARALRAELDGWLSSRVSAAEIPKSVAFGSALPRNAQGKLCDWAIVGGSALADERRSLVEPTDPR